MTGIAKMDGLLTRDEAAEFLRISVSTLKRHVEKTVKPVRVGARVFLKQDELSSFLAMTHIPKADDSTGFVYFIEADGTNRIKIGWSKNVRARLKTLQTGSPGILTLRAALRGHAHLEKDLHRRFDDLRIEGEWFHLAGVLKLLVDNLCAAK